VGSRSIQLLLDNDFFMAIKIASRHLLYLLFKMFDLPFEFLDTLKFSHAKFVITYLHIIMPRDKFFNTIKISPQHLLFL